MEHSESSFIRFDQAAPGSVRQYAARHTNDVMVLSMLVSDLLGILTAVGCAALLRIVVLGPMIPASYAWVPAFIAIFVISASLRGLYPALGMSAVEQFRNLTIATSILFLAIIAGTYFFQVSHEISRALIAASWLFCLITIPFNRTIIRHLVARAQLWGEPVAVIGFAPAAHRIASYFRRYPKVGLRPEILINVPDDFRSLDELDRAAFIQRVVRLQQTANLSTLIVVYDRLDQMPIVREAFRDVFPKIVLIPAEANDLELGGVRVGQYGNLLTFEIRHSLMDRPAQLQKRTIDLLISGLGLLVLSPLLALISLLIIVDSPGGVFYRQQRLGKGDRAFGMLKFRTMHQDADAVLQAVLAANPDQRREWDRYQKLTRDPRITLVGRFLRRFSLDELPQLINVLLGDMSIVGPRPIMLNQRELYAQNYRHYIRVMPGITGLWQISGRNHTSFAQRTLFDVEYVNSWSVWTDIYIIARTLWVILRRDGAC